MWQAGSASSGVADQLRSHIRPLDAQAIGRSAKLQCSPLLALMVSREVGAHLGCGFRPKAYPRSATGFPTHGHDRFTITCSTPLAHSVGRHCPCLAHWKCDVVVPTLSLRAQPPWATCPPSPCRTAADAQQAPRPCAPACWPAPPRPRWVACASSAAAPTAARWARWPTLGPR
jgi:hypothetical protein